jgi:hypothetical protein
MSPARWSSREPPVQPAKVRPNVPDPRSDRRDLEVLPGNLNGELAPALAPDGGQR